MSDALSARYARHFSLAEIGTGGQARIAASRVRRGAGDDAAAEIALAFLARAGMQVSTDGAALDVASTDAIALAAGRPELIEAAALLAGSLAATAHLAKVVGVETRTPALPALSHEPRR